MSVKRIALTGGIACGKTTAATYLRQRGFPVLDADAISRSLTAPNGAGLPPIREAFGAGVFHPDGTLNRRALGDIVFADEAARERLNSILHPLIMKEMREQAAALDGPHFMDIPLLYEIGAEKDADAVWAVYCEPEIQLERLMKRDNLRRDQALARVASQISAEEKARRADIVIDTSRGWPEARAQIDRALERVLNIAKP